MHAKKCLPTYVYNLHFCAVFSLQMSSAIEISTILATPKVTKTNDIWINDVFLTFFKVTFHPKVMRTPFECILPGCLRVSCLFVTNICILFSIITANTSSDFYNSYRRLQAKLFSPPEPSRAKFTPSGRAWTLGPVIFFISWRLFDGEMLDYG